MLSPEVLRHHIDYTAWASRRLVEAAAALTPEELTRDFGTSDKSVLGTLVHIFAADRIWMARIEGFIPQAFVNPEADMRMEALEQNWPQIHAFWKQWAAHQTADSLTEVLTYRDLKGREWSSPLWQIALHVVNHATHHRGQVAGFLRSMGKTPPVLDLIAYYRQL